jgi:hypothetical protein
VRLNGGLRAIESGSGTRLGFKGLDRTAAAADHGDEEDDEWKSPGHELGHCPTAAPGPQWVVRHLSYQPCVGAAAYGASSSTASSS